MSDLAHPPARSESPVPALRDALSGATLDPARPLLWRSAAPGVAEYELVQDEEVLGEMESGGRSGVDAFGECVGRSLELILEPPGFWPDTKRMESRAPDGPPGPSFTGAFFGWGHITSAAGESMRWRRGLWHFYSSFLFDEEGEELLRMKPSFLRFVRWETRVEVQPAGAARPDLAELLLVTFFLRIHIDRPGRRVFRRRDDGTGDLGELGPGSDEPERIDGP